MLRYTIREDQITGKKEVELDERAKSIVETIAATPEPTNADVVFLCLLILEILTGTSLAREEGTGQ